MLITVFALFYFNHCLFFPLKEDGDDKSKTKKGKVEDKPEETKKESGGDDFSSEATTKDGKKWNLKVVSWNVDGLRAWMKVRAQVVYMYVLPNIFFPSIKTLKCHRDYNNSQGAE